MKQVLPSPSSELQFHFEDQISQLSSIVEYESTRAALSIQEKADTSGAV